LPGVWGEVSKLNHELTQREWLSTQERNALVMAGVSAMKERGKVWKSVIMTGAEKRTMEADQVAQITSRNGESASGFSIKNSGETDLFIDVAMNGYPALKPDVESRGITIQRRYLDLEGVELPEETFHINATNIDNTGDNADTLVSGRRFIVELRFKADERVPNALMVDLLPACLELEDPSLEGSSTIDDLMVDGKSVSKWHQGFTIRHTEYRDDRFVAAVDIDGGTLCRIFYPVRVVTPGEFLVPPPLIEDMYRPYIRGVGDAVPLMLVH